jgi:hypothetical protein
LTKPKDIAPDIEKLLAEWGAIPGVHVAFLEDLLWHANRMG